MLHTHTYTQQDSEICLLSFATVFSTLCWMCPVGHVPQPRKSLCISKIEIMHYLLISFHLLKRLKLTQEFKNLVESSICFNIQSLIDVIEKKRYFTITSVSNERSASLAVCVQKSQNILFNCIHQLFTNFIELDQQISVFLDFNG